MIGFLLLAQLSQPVPKLQTCQQYGYGYCVPGLRAPREAVVKVSPRCPYGWYTQNGYCVRSD